LITETNKEPIFGAIGAKIIELGGIVQAINAMSDHIHVVVSLPPNISLSDAVGQIKGVSSHVASRLPNSDRFVWQRDYGVVSLSESHLPVIIRYVEQQQQHHQAKTLDARLELQD
jgi:putative transposase